MEHALYLDGIKKALKAKGITYTDLAQHLRMTESGVKKMLNAKDISFRRMVQICEVLHMLPGELLSLSECSSIPNVALSKAQENALLQDRVLLAVYWRFAIERRSVSTLEKLLGMKPGQAKSYMQKLVRLELIASRRGEYFPKIHGKFRWSDASRLAQVLNREWSEIALHRALEGQGTEGVVHRLSAMRLTQKSYDLLRVRLLDLLDDAVKTAEREAATMNDGELSSVTCVVALIPQSVLDR